MQSTSDIDRIRTEIKAEEKRLATIAKDIDTSEEHLHRLTDVYNIIVINMEILRAQLEWTENNAEG